MVTDSHFRFDANDDEDGVQYQVVADGLAAIDVKISATTMMT